MGRVPHKRQVVGREETDQRSLLRPLGLDAGAAALGEEGYKVGSARAQLEAGQGATTPGLVLHLSHQPQLNLGAEKYLHTEEECLKSRESASGGLLCHKRDIIASLLPHQEIFLHVYTVKGNLKI